MFNIYDFCFIQELEELIIKINRKFRDSIDAYLHCATVYFKLNKPGKARFIMQKALSNLPAKSRQLKYIYYFTTYTFQKIRKL